MDGMDGMDGLMGGELHSPSAAGNCSEAGRVVRLSKGERFCPPHSRFRSSRLFSVRGGILRKLRLEMCGRSGQ